jgi:hypothetical protein
VADFPRTCIVQPKLPPAYGEESSLGFRAVYVALGLALILYLVQVFTPLRLNTDAIDYLSLADGAARGRGFSSLWHADFHFPKGYPAFAYLMMKTGWFSSALLVISNLVLFGFGLVFSFLTLTRVGFSRKQTMIACLMTLLSFAAVKHITQGMSDFLFFALSTGACWLMTRQGSYKWFPLIPCVAFAMETRLAGLALAVPLLVMAWQFAKQRPIALIFAGLAAAICLAIGIWAGRHYLSADIEYLGVAKIGDVIVLAAIRHCQDFAELIFNVPLAKLPSALSNLMLFVGAIALVFFLAGAFALRQRSLWLSAYLVAYTALVLPWPFTDVRFWLPIMPFVFLAIWSGLLSLRDIPVRATGAYVVLFCAMGFVALGYSTSLTFSGSKFPSRYGDGLLRSTYLTGCSPASFDGRNDRALELLRRYEWHCQ